MINWESAYMACGHTTCTCPVTYPVTQMVPIVTLSSNLSTSICCPLSISPRGGGRGLIFAGYVPLASQNPYPLIIYPVATYRPHLSLFLSRYVIFAIPTQSSHPLFLWIDPFFRLNEEYFTFHLRYKHSGTSANGKYEELSYPKKSENVRPHSSDSF